ncbi:CPBP family intramembrane glutamic endopeptidase, partial [Streptococcus suis]|uniref:CPBP family intramembrane glutamic endopeptidase n=1 Tax=Streptococcus suis TaxID=1307 RepID=UPI0023B29E9A
DYSVSSSWFHKIQWPILLYIAFFIFQLLIPISESQNQTLVIQFVSAYPLVSFLSVVIFAPILEELIFRGLLATYFFPKMADMKAVGIYLAVTGSLFLPFVKSIKVFDKKYFESRNPNMEIILFWTKV